MEQMNRRTLLKAGATASFVAKVSGSRAATSKSTGKRPNVLYVFSDQHRAVSLPGAPFNEAQAPNIDAFRHANLSMDMCVSNYPLCTPYRGIFMSGRYPAQTGLEANGIALKTSEYTLTRAFKDAGYRVGYVGKWHLSGADNKFIPEGPDRFAIDDWHVWSQTNNHYHSWTYDPHTGERINPEGWSPVPMTDQAIDFLKARAAEKKATPWLLVLSWNPPHPPFDPPAVDQAPYAGQLKGRPNVQLPASGGAEHVADAAGLHRAQQGYYGGIQGVDEQFGRLLKAVDDLQLAQDTIVIYTSDHGEMMGSQGKMAKQMPWDESCRVPFAIRWPGVTPAHATSATLFAAIDIYPTLCGLAGIAVPKHCMGQDLSGVLRGKKMPTPKEVFLLNGPGNVHAEILNQDEDAPMPPPIQASEAGPDAAGLGPAKRGRRANNAEAAAIRYRGLRTATHTYAVTAEGRWLLYDNVADPYQMQNLAKDPAQKALMDGFDAKLRAWMKSTGDAFPFPANM